MTQASLQRRPVSDLPTPAVFVLMDTVERNIRKAVSALSYQRISHRPHIKAHKSLPLARLQEALGCQGITCAKLGEAEVMAAGGCYDILVAYPLIGEEKIARYARLIDIPGMKIRTIINSLPGAGALSVLGESLGRKLTVYIELDGGIGRGGLPLGAPLEDFCLEAAKLPGINIDGAVCYSGGIYASKSPEEVRRRARQERDELLEAQKTLRRAGLSANVLSGGSSFSLRVPEELRGVTEVRAGNYIFNDCALLGIGMISVADCALRVLATVVARPSPDTAIIDAGSKTLTSDLVNSRPGFGYVIEDPEAVIFKLNEEHGFARIGGAIPWAIGDKVTIIPNHACVIPNLCRELYEIRDSVIAGRIPVSARGKCQ